MSEIEFIQFLPNNVRKRVLIDRSDDIAAMAKALKDRGFRLECKSLGDGQSMVAVADATLDFLLASRTVKDGPDVLTAVDGLITDVHAVLVERDKAKRAAKFMM